MKKEELEKWEMAGKIAAEAREYSKSIISEGKKLLDVAEKIEEKIFELGGKPAFPVDLGVDWIAAHYSPRLNEKTVFKKGDLVKVDIGVSVDGYIGDTACTVEVGSNKNKKLIEAAETALKEALKLVKPGVKVCEIGGKIQGVIQEFGFSPIKNLSGHGIERWNIHSGLTIPNYDNGNMTELKKGQVIAIEPFATTGIGKVIEGKGSEVFGLLKRKPVRNEIARKILDYIEENYKTLPFAKRWLVKKFLSLEVTVGLRFLERAKIIKEYPLLPEESKCLVSQAEHTLIVGEKVLTKI